MARPRMRLAGRRVWVEVPGPTVKAKISPEDIERYLLAQCWHPHKNDALSDWIKPRGPGRPDRFVMSPRDASSRLDEILWRLALYEERSQGEVLRDIEALARSGKG